MSRFDFSSKLPTMQAPFDPSQFSFKLQNYLYFTIDTAQPILTSPKSVMVVATCLQFTFPNTVRGGGIFSEINFPKWNNNSTLHLIENFGTREPSFMIFCIVLRMGNVVEWSIEIPESKYKKDCLLNITKKHFTGSLDWPETYMPTK